MRALAILTLELVLWLTYGTLKREQAVVAKR
jgi:hypothetical protein